jgi:hypothetical protein
MILRCLCLSEAAGARQKVEEMLRVCEAAEAAAIAGSTLPP